jgi:hypothetical protein
MHGGVSLFVRSAWRKTAASIAGACFLILVMTPGLSLAYNDDGHFYTVLAVMHGAQPPFDGKAQEEAALMAFCAQMPDLAEELEAVTLRAHAFLSLSGAAWGTINQCWSEEVRHMVTVHHYLHALTGTADASADTVAEAARVTIATLLKHPRFQSDANVVCAAGLGLHLLGDAFAHRRLDAPGQMYPAGMGHFSDRHYPDYMSYAQRPALYRDYIDALQSALGLRSDAGERDMLVKIAQTSAQDPAEGFSRLVELKGLLKDDFQYWAPGIFSREPETMKAVYGEDPPLLLDKTFDMVIHKAFPQYAGIQYAKVWGTYKKAAIPAFKSIPAACDPDSAGTAVD